MTNMSDNINTPTARRAPSNPARAIARLSAMALASMVCLALYYAHTLFTSTPRRLDIAAEWTRRWAAVLARIMGMKIQVSGPYPPPSALLVPNHQGYADIFALGSYTPCFFVAKAEVARWPFIGRLFRATRHIGLRREDKRPLAHTIERVAERLRSGHRACVFLEGTTTGGDRILAFKPSMAQAALDAQAPVVPIAIRYEGLNTPINVMEDIAYWKDHVLATHMWRLLGLNGFQATISFGLPIVPEPDTDRKALAQLLCVQVAEMAGLPILPPAYPCGG